MRSDACVLILSHRRPDRVHTFRTLRRSGYTGPIFIVLDDGDPTADQYIEKFGASAVRVFSKAEAAAITDKGDNFPGDRGVVYARNAAFDVARDLGFTSFLVLDDDYTNFSYRFDSAFYYRPRAAKHLDEVFDAIWSYLEATPFASICIAQGGDYIGGEDSKNVEQVGVSRKAMNSFFCRTDRRFRFSARINEDVVAYTEQQRAGVPFLTIYQVSLAQIQTQQNSGGMTELYLDVGTYVKSWYAVMYAPSCVSIAEMGNKWMRLHHKVDWNACAPKIMRESLRRL